MFSISNNSIIEIIIFLYLTLETSNIIKQICLRCELYLRVDRNKTKMAIHYIFLKSFVCFNSEDRNELIMNVLLKCFFLI